MTDSALDPYFTLICTQDDPAISVACPQCLANAGAPCVTDKGKPVTCHKPRRLTFLADYVTKCQVTSARTTN